MNVADEDSTTSLKNALKKLDMGYISCSWVLGHFTFNWQLIISSAILRNFLLFDQTHLSYIPPFPQTPSTDHTE
jgi:hypothetical protein